MLSDFKNFNAKSLDIDQLVTLAAFGRKLREEYEFHSIDEPAWLDVNLKSLRREIQARNADKLELRKREIDNRLAALKTPAEKKAELLREKREIDKQLAEV